MNNIDPNKDYIYVLKLVDDRYYIGRSQNIVQRIEDHFSGNGSVYTKKYKPLNVVEIVEEKTNDDERNKTIEYIGKYTWEKVRGYAWCKVEYKTPFNIINATKKEPSVYDKIDENIRKLYCLDNKDIIEIGKELNLTPGSIAYNLKKMNIVLSKKLANGYNKYITSDAYKEICKNYSVKKIKPKYTKPNVIREKNNYKEQITKIMHDNKEIKFDTKNIKDTIRNLLLKSNLE
jgi:predicted GIY-YIG superfamily endonuclease